MQMDTLHTGIVNTVPGSKTPAAVCRRAATVGTFDGVHRGHKVVLAELRRRAAEEGLQPIVVTFDPHPLRLIAPERTPVLLTTAEYRLELLQAEGVQPLMMRFDESLRRMTVAEWMRRLHDRHGIDLLLVGYDNTFGSDGLEMSTADYRAIGETVGIRVEEAPELPGVSSSAVRRAVLAGEMERARDLLGRPFVLDGIVVHGQGLGRTLGFPTANVDVSPGLAVPSRGVYAAMAVTARGERVPAVVNIGVRPTVGAFSVPTVEASLIDYCGDLYDTQLKLEFVARLRDERRFANLDLLKEQIGADVKQARRLLGDEI